VLSRVPLALSRSDSSSSKTAASAAERAQRAEEKAREKLAKTRAKETLKADKVVEKLLARCHRGAFAEQEIHTLLHEEFRQTPRFAKLLSGLQENKLSFSFPASPSSAAAASASAPSGAASASGGYPCSASSLEVLRSLPRCVVWERRQAPEAVSVLRAHKRARLLSGPVDAWRSMEDDAARAEQQEAMEREELARKQRQVGSSSSAAAAAVSNAEPEVMEELPAPQPVNSILVLLSGAGFLQLHSSAQLQPSLTRWLGVLDRHYGQGAKTLLVVVHGLYALVQLEATQALQQRRANAAAKQNGLSPSPSPSPPPSADAKSSVKPLKKLSEVDALLASLWFSTQGRVRFKMLSDEAECIGWIVSLTNVLAKAPYKDNMDSALTLVNTGRTDVSTHARAQTMRDNRTALGIPAQFGAVRVSPFVCLSEDARRR
jgi:hypothetical protein